MATAKAVSTSAPMTAEEKKVIFASSLGTVFEWYDFYLYGSLAAIISLVQRGVSLNGLRISIQK